MRFLIILMTFFFSGCEYFYLKENDCGSLGRNSPYLEYGELSYKLEIYRATHGIKIIKAGEYSYDFCRIYKTKTGARVCFGSNFVIKSKLLGDLDKSDCPDSMKIIRDASFEQ